MPYARNPRGSEQLDGFSDVLKRLVGDVGGVVSRVESGARQVQNVAATVEQQAPRIQAIIDQPRAAYGGAVIGAQAADSGFSPFLVAIGAGLLVAGVVHVVRNH